MYARPCIYLVYPFLNLKLPCNGLRRGQSSDCDCAEWAEEQAGTLSSLTGTGAFDAAWLFSINTYFIPTPVGDTCITCYCRLMKPGMQGQCILHVHRVSMTVVLWKLILCSM